MFSKLFGRKQETKATGMIKMGTRVVRGPHWNSGYQDNGEGFLGTLVQNENPDIRHVTVIWDSGKKFTYRARNNEYDLRVYDTAPTGIIHPKVACSSCKSTDIHGIRWKCKKCGNVDLCSPCYMNDKHDITHKFVRIDTPNADGIDVKPRANSSESRKIVKGTLKGAEVMRGPDWNQGQRDGGDVGYVETIESWYDKYHRGAVKVVWKYNELEDLYRVGAEGCVDVIYSRMTETAEGGQYYADHLPCVDFQSIDYSTYSTEIMGKATAVYDYDTRGSDDISFKKGDTLLLLDCSDENWWWARKVSNETYSKEGYIPKNYVILNYGKHKRESKGIVECLADLNQGDDDYNLTINAGEFAIIVDDFSENYFIGRHADYKKGFQEGKIPKLYVSSVRITEINRSLLSIDKSKVIDFLPFGDIWTGSCTHSCAKEFQ